MSKNRQSVNIKKNSFELLAWNKQLLVAGIDEVGRGCLAGPVVAAAVILPINTTYKMLKDSKLMTMQERLKAFKWIKKHCSYGIGIVHHRIIDERNIWRATLIAMKKALMHLSAGSHLSPSAILIDAMPLSLTDTHLHDIPVHHFPFGERKSSSIAAASIVAKVTRDAMMESFDMLIPGYILAENKGYATKAHKTAIKINRHSIIHRIHFLGATCIQQADEDMQMSLVKGLTNDNAGDENECSASGEILCGSD